MVFESLITPWRAEKKPWEMLFFGFLYASFSIALGLWIFRDNAGLISVFFTVMFCIPLIYNTLKIEEEKANYISEESSLLKEHSRALMFFIFLFIGMTLAFATWFVALPSEVSQSIFSVQLHTIADINTKAVGNAVLNSDILMTIIFNNIRVLIFSILFSLFFGAGAIFILTWNASIIAVAMGTFINSYILVTDTGILVAHIGAYSGAVLRYFIHGIPEMAAYFVGALAGGIISVAIVRKDIMTKNFQKIAFDTSNLIILSILLIVLAGIIETYITPFFY